MFKTGTAEKSAQSKGVFRDFDGIEPAESLFQVEEPEATEHYHVSAVDDPEEISAERTADQVTGGGSIFREADGPGAEGGEVDLPSADLAEPGSALPMGIQQSMGASMGADFSGVRVHTGARADRASRSLSARAFARGQDLYFRGGEYNPDSQEGQHLIAHELAHVADGADGLHRDPAPSPTPAPSPVPAPSPAPASSTSDMSTVAKAENAITVTDDPNAASGKKVNFNAATLETSVGTMKKAVELVVNKKDNYKKKYVDEESVPQDQSTAVQDKAEVENAQSAVDTANEYIRKIETVLRTATATREQEQILNSQKTTLEGVSDETQAQIVATCLSQVKRATGNVSLSDVVTAMLENPYASKFIEAANEIAGMQGAAFAAAEESAAAKAALADKFESGTTAEEKRRHLGLSGGDIKDRSKHDSSAAEWVSFAGETISDTGDLVADATELGMTQHGSDDEKAGSTSDKISNIAGGTGAALSTLGAAMSAGSSGAEATDQKKMGEKAKQSMKSIAAQLDATLPAEGARTPDDRSDLMGKLCKRIEGGNFTEAKNRAPLSADIDGCMAEKDQQNNALQPDLTGKQKRLLSTLQVLETGRAARERDAKRENINMAFSITDAVSNLFSAAGSFTSLGEVFGGSEKAGLAGSILSMISSGISLVSSIVQKGMEGSMEKLEAGDQQKEKFAACRAVVQQLSAAGPLSQDLLTRLNDKKDGGNSAVSQNEMEMAERYASALSTLEAADVNIADFLYAVQEGKFSEKVDDGSGGQRDKTTAERLNGMYANLSFS